MYITTMVINYLIFEVPSDVSILIILLKPESIRKMYKATNVIYKKNIKKMFYMIKIKSLWKTQKSWWG